MQQAAVNQLITDQLTKFVFDGDNRLQFLSRFPEVAAHFGFIELIHGEPPMARLDVEERWHSVSLSTTYMRMCTKLFGKEIN